MSLDPVTNFAKCTVSLGYDAAATTIVLSSGEGALLPDAALGDFNLVWYNATDYPDPSDDPNKEIVRVTNRVGDTLTITRAQEGTSASAHNTAAKVYKVILAITKKMIDDIRTAQNASAWVLDYTPPEAVNGSNAVFTIPVEASQIIVYADGIRVKGGGVTYTFTDDDTINFVSGLQPFSSLSVDYLPM